MLGGGRAERVPETHCSRQLGGREQHCHMSVLTAKSSEPSREFALKTVWGRITLPPRPLYESQVLGMKESVIGINT